MFYCCFTIFLAKNQLEFCCHMLRGTIDTKEPPVYEYVKFIGNFKSLNNGELHYTKFHSLEVIFLEWVITSLFPFSSVPNCTRNGFEGVIQRSFHSAFEDRVCLIATVRLAKPQFIKVSIINCSFSSTFPFICSTHFQFYASGFEKDSFN